MILTAGVMPMPEATQMRLSKLDAAPNGEGKGPYIHAGRQLGRFSAACTASVQSPTTAMHTLEVPGFPASCTSEKA